MFEQPCLFNVSVETFDFLGQLLIERNDMRALETLSGRIKDDNLQINRMALAYANRTKTKAWPLPSLRGIDLRGAVLCEYDFRNLDLPEARFNGGDLRGAKFGSSVGLVDLRGADFSGAQLHWAEFMRCIDTPSLPQLSAPDIAPLAAPRPENARLQPQKFGYLSAFSLALNNEPWLAVANGNQIQIMDLRNGHILQSLTGHTGWVTQCAFSPDNKTILSASVDNTLKLWDIQSGQCIKTFEGHSASVSSCAFSPDNKTILSSSGNEMRVWDVATGACLKVIYELSDGETFDSLCCSGDHKTVLAATDGAWRHFGWVDPSPDHLLPTYYPLESFPLPQN